MELSNVSEESAKVRLNIGGTIFLTFDDTIKQFPESFLARLSQSDTNYDNINNEYFFDRNPVLFAFILDAYRKKEIHLPSDICGPTFRKELEFWDLSLSHVAPCCYESLYKSDDDVKTVNKLMDNYRKNESLRMSVHNRNTRRTKIWLFLDDPNSSRFATAWVTFISLLVLASTGAELLATVPDLGREEYTEEEKEGLDIIIDLYNLDNRTTELVYSLKPNMVLSMTVVVCHVILTFELIFSFIVCPAKKLFALNVVRILALLGYVTFWISFGFELNFANIRIKELIIVYVFCKYATILKLARLFYLSKYIPTFNVVGLTFSSSISEFKILVFLLGILVCVFGYIMYAVEFLDNEKINSSFSAMYWALITLTTVGYGDIIPKTVMGHVVTSFCAVCGIIVLALPIGIMASTFSKFYNFNAYVLAHIRLNDDVLNTEKLKAITDDIKPNNELTGP